MFKKGIAALMAIVMVLAAFPISALAVTEGQKPADGTTTSQPFVLGTPSANYRIPCIVTLNDGTLVAAADARWNSLADGGGNDTIVSRSSDNGATWNYTFANYLGDNGNQFNSASTAFCDSELATDGQNVYMLSLFFPAGVAITSSGTYQKPVAAAAFDSNGRLLLGQGTSTTYNYYLGEFNSDGFANIYSTSGTAVSGYTVDREFSIYYNGTRQGSIFYSDAAYQTVKTSFLFFRSSTDKGATWSSPTLVPAKTASESFLGVGPGRGIVIDKPDNSGKRIVFSTYTYAGSAASQRSYIVYSDDGGKTWSRSQAATDTSNFTSSSTVWSSENQLVELNDGTIRMVFRNGNNKICYVDWTWNTSTKSYSRGNVVMTSETNCSDCMISVIKYPYLVNGKQCLLVTCPRTSGTREQGCIYSFLLNDDNTIDTSGTEHWNITNAGYAFSYSCLTVLNDGRLGVLYEGTNTAITFATFNVATITGKTVTTPTTKTNVTLKPGQTATYSAATSSYTNTFDSVVGVSANGSSVTLTGKNEGVSQVVIGNTQYNVTVQAERKSVTLKVGEEITYDATSASYTNSNSNVVSVSTVQSGSAYKATFRGITSGTAEVLIGGTLYTITVEAVLSAEEKLVLINNLGGLLEDKLADTTKIYKNLLPAYEAYLKAKEYYDSFYYGENTAEMTDSTVTTNTTKKTEAELDVKIKDLETAIANITSISVTTMKQTATYSTTQLGWQNDYNDSGDLKYSNASPNVYNSDNFYKNILYSTVGKNFTLSASTAAAEAATATAYMLDDKRTSSAYINILIYFQPTVFLYDGSSDMSTTVMMVSRSAKTGTDAGRHKVYAAYPTTGAVKLPDYWYGKVDDTLGKLNFLWTMSSSSNRAGYSSTTACDVPAIDPRSDYSVRAHYGNVLQVDTSKLSFGSDYTATYYPMWEFQYNKNVTFTSSSASSYYYPIAGNTESQTAMTSKNPIVVINYKQVANDFSVSGLNITSHDVDSAKVSALLSYMDSSADALNPSNGSVNYANGITTAVNGYNTNAKVIISQVNTLANAVKNSAVNTDYDSLRTAIVNSPLKENNKCYAPDAWQTYIDARKTAINAINNVVSADYVLTYSSKAITTIANELNAARNALAEGACHIDFVFASKADDKSTASYNCTVSHSDGVDIDGIADLDNAYNPLDAVYQTIDVNKYNDAGNAYLSEIKSRFDGSTAAGASFSNNNHLESDKAAQAYVDKFIAELLTGINTANDTDAYRTKFNVKITVDGKDHTTTTAYYNEPKEYTYTPDAGKAISKWVITTDDGKVAEIKSDVTSINFAVMSNATINIVTTDSAGITEAVLITGQRDSKNFAAAYVTKGSTVTSSGNDLLVDGNVIMTAPRIPFYTDVAAWEVDGVSYPVGKSFTVNADTVAVPRYKLMYNYTVQLEDVNAGTITTYTATNGEISGVDQSGTLVNPQMDQRMQLKAADDTDFYAWALVTDDGYEIVSYNAVYDFFCEGNAVYRIIRTTDSDIPEYVPYVRIRNANMAIASEGSINGCFIKNPDADGKYRVSVISQVVKDEADTKYTVNDCGIIASKSPIAEKDFEIGGQGVAKISSPSQTIAGQYSITLTNSTAMYPYLTVRSYVTYSYVYSGAVITITTYSDPIVVENS